MSDWTGSGTTIPSVPSTAPACLEYFTIADVRAEFGTEVEDDTDVSIQRRIDQLSAYLEDQIGHTFGRALIARSSSTDTVEVTATGVVIGGDTYLFADYITLAALVTAINAVGDTYSVELLPRIRPDTPSVLLKLHGLTTCGPDYNNRVVLCTSALFCLLSGKYQSHLFVPLPIVTINTVVEDLITLTTADYWALPGETWLIRKSCGCTTACNDARGKWSAAYPGNIGVSYVPYWLGQVPGALQGLLLEAFSARGGLSAFQQETFGDYSYKRPTAPVAGWTDVLGGGALRQYTVRFQP